jgi:hypothetical protein
MLNNRKNKIVKEDANIIKPSFLHYPKLPKASFVQSTSTRQLRLGLNTVFNITPSNSAIGSNINRFEYNSKQFREFFIFNSLMKKPTSTFNRNNLKQFFFFLKCAFKERKKVSFYLLKRIKGGYMISVLGVICFVPRSLFKISSKQQIISFKLYKKSKKFARPNLKLNLVSSLIQKK